MIDIVKNIEKYWFNEGHLNINQRDYIIEVLSEIKPKNCIEIGFASGRSLVTTYFSCSPKRILSIDANLDYIDGARKFSEELQNDFKEIKIIEKFSRDVDFNQIKKLYFENEFIDFAFIDGGHSYNDCYHDLLNLYKISHMNTIFLVDDYKSNDPDGYYLPEVTRAVDEFVKNFNLIKTEWNKNGKGFAKIII